MKKLCLLMIGTALVSTPAYAQSETDTIIVTARKFEERIQDSPASIKYISGQDIQDQSINEVGDIFGFGAQKKIVMSGDALLLSARGQVQNDISITTDSSVGTYLDGIYVGRGYGLNTTLLDVSNVQIVYGPQGTLFGRNTTGGAVLIETNSPVPNEYSLTASGTWGDENDRSIQSVINVPLTDSLTVRAAGLVQTENGFTTDRITGNTYGDNNTHHGRVKLQYVPFGEGILAEVTGEYYKSEGNTEARFMDYGFGRNAPLATMNPGDTVAINDTPYNATEIHSISGNLQVNDFKILGGYRRVQSNHFGDWDGTPLSLYTQSIDVDVEQLTAEAQYSGQILSTKYTLGGFYYNEKGYELSRAYFFGGFSNSRFSADINNKSYGAYLATYTPIATNLTLNASVRYTRDEKDLITKNAAIRPDNSVIACTTLGAVTAQDCRSRQSTSYDKITWSVGLDYQLANDTLVYAKVGTGYKSGGNQNRAVFTENAFFSPENITEGEVGIKGTLGLVTYSAAAFYNEVNNYQILTIYTVPFTHTLVKNAAKTRNFGGEISAAVNVTDNLRIRGTAAFVDPKFLEYSDPANGRDLSGNRFNNVTPAQFSVDAVYTIDNFRFAAVYNWMKSTPKAGVSYNDLVTRYGQTEADKIYSVTQIPDFGILNLRAGATFGSINTSLWVNNVFNTRYKKDTTFNEGLWNTSTWNDERSYGVTVGFQF